MAARRSAQCHKQTLRHEAACKMWMAPMGGSGPSQPRWRGDGVGESAPSGSILCPLRAGAEIGD